MKLYIKQRLFTIGEQFTVYNEQGEDAYYVEGSFFRIPKEFVIYNTYHEPVCRIEKHFITFLPKYSIETQHGSVQLNKNFTFFRASYNISGRAWELQGDFLSRQYRVVYGSQPIMAISRHWFTLGDSYELDIYDDSDALLCLGIVIAIDKDISDSRNNN